MRRMPGSMVAVPSGWRAIVLPWVLLGALSLPAQVDSLERVLAGLPQDTSRLRVLRALFHAEVFRRPARASTHAEAFAALADAGGTARQRAQAQAMLGQALYVRGDGLRALPHFQRSLATYRAEGLIGEAGLVQANIASILADARHWNEARMAYARALADLEQAGEHEWAAGAEGELAQVLQLLGRHDSAALHYRRSAEALERHGMARHAHEILLDEAGALFRSGRTTEAVDRFRALDSASVGVPAPLVLIRLLLRSGRWSLAHDQPADADSLLRRALRLAVDGGFVLERTLVHEALSDLEVALGRPDSALAQLRRFIQWNDTLDARSDAAAILALERRASDALSKAELEHRAAVIARQRTQLVLVGAAVLLLAAIAFALAFVLRRERRHRNALADRTRALEDALQAKGLLLREIHHRVKNNLQIVSGLLRAQLRAIRDPAVRAPVRDGLDRIRSMSLIHQDLYHHDGVQGIEMAPYVERLAQGLRRSHAVDEDHVAIHLDVAPLWLDVDTAIPLGLVINELITNALKHAFPDGRKGRIEVSLHHERDGLLLTVADDGVGLPEPLPAGADGSGLVLVRTFAEKLKAEQHVRTGPGTTVRLRIHLPPRS
ncbi:MAG TPA: histidine kinase dimerization/phosphoacceptor domain -containing protein [Flavobacteriales bacterium]|nr:histidine kinase dimerization/phosphoacceptor domain -containing protein [Flavobacteriales bacterium]HMR26123.1 histidine kinase dimerization/phosphoacceptor domain -containing protein [Flavobacteriales bacterium]